MVHHAVTLVVLSLALAAGQLSFAPEVLFNGKFFEYSQNIKVCLPNNQQAPSNSVVGLADTNGNKVDPNYESYAQMSNCVVAGFSLDPKSNHPGTYTIGLWSSSGTVIALSPTFQFLPKPILLVSASTAATPTACGYIITFWLGTTSTTYPPDRGDYLYFEAFTGNVKNFVPAYDQSLSIAGWNLAAQTPHTLVIANPGMYNQGIATGYNVYFSPGQNGATSSVKVSLGGLGYSNHAPGMCAWTVTNTY